jgi:D-glycero-alpha-D-manno-heptose-7-phosphate kinase
LDLFGTLLHESWMHKRRVASGISTAYIDHCYELARGAGATGGKITGAGGGGFLLLYCREEHQAAVDTALTPLGLVRMRHTFSSQGVRVLLNDPGLDAERWPC